MEEFDCQIVYIMILKTKGTKTAIENARQTSKKKSNGQGKKSSDNISNLWEKVVIIVLMI